MLIIGLLHTFASVESTSKTLLMKKILILYIANGGRWEDCFEDFFFWSFDYSMWVKMNLFYERARDGFRNDDIFSAVSVRSPLDLVEDHFTRAQIETVIRENGFKTNPANYLSKLRNRSKIVLPCRRHLHESAKKSVSQSVKKCDMTGMGYDDLAHGHSKSQLLTY